MIYLDIAVINNLDYHNMTLISIVIIYGIVFLLDTGLKLGTGTAMAMHQLIM